MGLHSVPLAARHPKIPIERAICRGCDDDRLAGIDAEPLPFLLEEYYRVLPFLARDVDRDPERIQVCADASDLETPDPELRAIGSLAPKYPDATAFLLLIDRDAITQSDPNDVIAMPAAEWLLDPDATAPRVGPILDGDSIGWKPPNAAASARRAGIRASNPCLRRSRAGRRRGASRRGRRQPGNLPTSPSIRARAARSVRMSLVTMNARYSTHGSDGRSRGDLRAIAGRRRRRIDARVRNGVPFVSRACRAAPSSPRESRVGGGRPVQ